MNLEQETRRNKLQSDIIAIDEAISQGDENLIATYKALKADKLNEIARLEGKEPTTAPEEEKEIVNCHNCGKEFKSNAGLVAHQRKCIVENKQQDLQIVNE